MKKSIKILLCVIGIFLVTSILIGISYAYYIFNVSQSGSNVVRTDCFEITYTDGNAINLSNTIPLSDKEAKELDPYTFTIKNICNNAVDYSINIETLEGSTMNLNGVRVRIDNYKSQILGDIENNDSSVIVNNNVLSSKTVKHGSIVANGSKTYNLRMYIDEESTMEETANKTFNSKVVVSAKLNPNYKEAMLIDGTSFNRSIKRLSNANADCNSDDTSIKSIERSTVPPTENDNYINVADYSSNCPIYAWLDNGTLYLYSDVDKIFMNSDSSYSFYSLKGLNFLDLSYFDTSKVTNMSSMFKFCSNLYELNVSSFDTSNVMNMSYMFSGMGSDKGRDMDLQHIYGIENFDTSNVTDMSSMFAYCSNLYELNVSSFDTSNVTDMRYMFGGWLNGNGLLKVLDISNFDTSNVTNMSGMFSWSSKLESIIISNSFDTSKVTNMSNMFYGMDDLTSLDLSGFNTSKVTNMSSMFAYCINLYELNVSSFDTSNVTNMKYMFSGMSSVSKIYVGNNWSVDNVSESTNMFSNCLNIVGGAGTTYDANHTDKEYARVDDPTNNKPGYFTLKTN